MITATGLTKRYARNTAVDQISFEVRKGSIVGFLGPNGAGKTTTMRMLTCFLPPTAGTATVAGFDVLEQPLEVKRRIGYLPETPPLYPEMRVAEYLAFVGRLKGLSGPTLRERVEYVLDRCNIGDMRQRTTGKLSKGYRQRVGLAQAIIHNPDVLILDEPTAGLDPKQIHEARSLIGNLAGDHTIILSTHILPEVEQTCQEVLIINRGKLVATGSVANLQHRTRGGESVLIEIGSRNGTLDPGAVERQLARVSGVSGVRFRDPRQNHLCAEVENSSDRPIRSELARAVIEAGWELHELRASAVSLEEVFLQLTREEAAGSEPAAAQEARP